MFDDDSWWSGAQTRLVGLVLAGAAAALGVSTALAGNLRHQDEITGTQRGTNNTSSQGGKRVQSATLFQRWTQTDELPTAAAPRALDGVDPALPRPVVLAPVVTTWTHQDDLQPTAPPPLREDEFWRAPTPLVPPPNLLLWAEGDERPTPPGATPQFEDDQWRALPVFVAPSLPPAWDQGERPTPGAAFTPHEEDAPLPRALVADANGIFWASEEGAIPASMFAEDDYWFVPVKLVAPVLPVLVDQNEIPSGGVVQGGGGGGGSPELRGRRAVATTQFIIQPAGDELPTAAAAFYYQEYWWQQRVVAVVPTLTVWLAQDEVVPAAVITTQASARLAARAFGSAAKSLALSAGSVAAPSAVAVAAKSEAFNAVAASAPRATVAAVKQQPQRADARLGAAGGVVGIASSTVITSASGVAGGRGASSASKAATAGEQPSGSLRAVAAANKAAGSSAHVSSAPRAEGGTAKQVSQPAAGRGSLRADVVSTPTFAGTINTSASGRSGMRSDAATTPGAAPPNNIDNGGFAFLQTPLKKPKKKVEAPTKHVTSSAVGRLGGGAAAVAAKRRLVVAEARGGISSPTHGSKHLQIRTSGTSSAPGARLVATRTGWEVHDAQLMAAQATIARLKAEAEYRLVASRRGARHR